MTTSLLRDALAHHVWVTLRLLDTCRRLSSDQLVTDVEGTYGPTIDTMRHLVGADTAYLFALTGGRIPVVDESRMDLEALSATMKRNGAAWESLLSQDLDPDAVVVRHRDDGSESHAPMGIRLAQAVHHGTDHRSQVCIALTTIGVEPPTIDVWDFAEQDGRLSEVPPSSWGAARSRRLPRR
jgi:uncharacterized damage-inducible protein DinB